ncbi:tripartite tricarboxylate transporter TctB family protein [Alcaligenaceae bacterium]|nr:tripartite tricarboxylate transporter TctB family protein [Alcaligenaceae bacterium]
MKISDLLAGLIVGVLGLGMIAYALTLPLMPGQNVGPGMFPTLIGSGFVICAVLLVARHVKSVARNPWLRLDPALRNGRILTGFLFIPLTLLLYIAFSETLGFLVCAFLFLLALFLVFRVRLGQAVLIAFIGSLAIHFLFYTMLEVPLPWGVLESIAW